MSSGTRVTAPSESPFRAQVELLYRAALLRPPDGQALAEAEVGLAAGNLTRGALLAQLVASDEFARLRSIEDGIAKVRRALASGEPARDLTAPPGVDERAIEIPWVLSRYRGEARVLDLGSANAEPLYLEALRELAPGVVGLDLVPAAIAGLDLRVGDLRDLPFPSRSLDAVLCISTLEHVGSSQARYGIEADTSAAGIAEALAEIRRVLSRDGYALVTVPCGREEDHGWFVQHGRAGWNGLFVAAGLVVADQELYVLSPQGWELGNDDQAGYGERGPGASAVLCSELRPRRLRVAARGRNRGASARERV
jgi:SAM-dependent methyltransferase